MGVLPFSRPFYPNYYRRPYPYKSISSINPSTSNSEVSTNFSDEGRNTFSDRNDNQSMCNYTDKNTNIIPSEERYQKERTPSKHNSFVNLNISNLLSPNLDEPVLEILGMSLFLDDILILGLLFFLYSEGVKDEMLFICLILLLVG